MTKLTIKDITHIGIFAALTAVLSQISIPLPFTPVPINLATFSVFLAGGLLGSKKAAYSQGIYVLLGMIGLPVFANLASGIGVAFGPTGGFIFGYVIAAHTIGNMKEQFQLKDITTFIIGLFCCYVMGTSWFMIATGSNFYTAFTMCVLPFLLGDAIKIGVASVVVKKLRKTI